MKIFLPIFLLLFLFDVGYAQFEGSLIMNIKKYPLTEKVKDSTREITEEKIKFYLGINDFRVESGDDGDMGGSFIIRLSKKIIILLSFNDKKYYEIPFGFFREMSAAMKEINIKDSISTGQKSKTDIKRTNEKRIIEGFDCTKYIITEDNGKTEAWVALKFTNFFKSFTEVGSEILSGGGKNEFDDEFYKELADKGGFPLLIIEKDKSGKILSESIVSGIEQKRPDDALFKPPKDFKMDKMENINN
jgi:hypothetical protein